MAHIIVVGSKAGPTWVGVSRKPETITETQKRGRGRAAEDLKVLFEREMPTLDAAEYIERVVVNRIIASRGRRSAGWWAGLSAREIVRITSDTVRLFERGPKQRDLPPVLKQLRLDTFKVSMSTFAILAGVSISQISRWESGSQQPSLVEIARLRWHAVLGHLSWPESFVYPEGDGQDGSTNVVSITRARGKKHGTKAKRRGRARNLGEQVAAAAARENRPG